jgi:DNA invertase Pin-like site-specific DNA recombinase
MATVGYGRVSTRDQSLGNQVKALTEAGCEKVFTDTVSGVAKKRPGWEGCREYLRPGDTLIITALDRLARSLRELLEISGYFDEHGIELRSLRESLDTSSAMGRLIFQLFGMIAEFERELIRERSLAGLKEARARGRVGGRPWSVSPSQMREIKRLCDEGDMTIKGIAEMFNTTTRTVYRVLDHLKVNGEQVR